MDLDNVETGIFKKALEMLTKKVIKFAAEEDELDMEGGNFSGMLDRCMVLMDKLNKKIDYDRTAWVAREGFVTKVTFFSKDKAEFGYSTSVRLPIAKFMVCQKLHLLGEIGNPSLFNKSGMILFEYFDNEKDYKRWLTAGMLDEDAPGPETDYFFVG